MIHRLRDMIGAPNVTEQFHDVIKRRSSWVRSVPEPFHGGVIDRCRDAWAVATGRAYAVKWPTGGELEDALGDLHAHPMHPMLRASNDSR